MLNTTDLRSGFEIAALDPNTAAIDLWVSIHFPAMLDELDRLQRENKILETKNAASLANNLCPDHRDKQVGKGCLACEIERLNRALYLDD